MIRASMCKVMRVKDPDEKPHERAFRRPNSSVWRFYVTGRATLRIASAASPSHRASH